MRVLYAFFWTVLALFCGLQADAARRTDAAIGRIAAETPLMIGSLEMVWGDPGPAMRAAGASTRFNVALLDDAGVRHALDPDEALRAAEDLYALYGRRVAVSTIATSAKAGAGQGGRVIDAIVPVDDLQPFSSAQAQAWAKGEKAIVGTTAWLTLLCKFSDIASEPETQAFYQTRYGSAAPLIDHYWREMSYGRINLEGSKAYNWRTLPQPRGYYVVNGAVNLTNLFKDCTAAFDAEVDFAANGGVFGMNMVFNAELDGYAYGGNRSGTLDGISKSWMVTWLDSGYSRDLNIIGHEMGHAYGLPHSNNSDGDGDEYDNSWDVMSDGNSFKHPVHGWLPPHINIYGRDRLGWVAAERKRTVVADGSTATLTLDRASLLGSTNTQMLVLTYPNQQQYYYTLEVRKRGGEYEKALAGDAVIIHHVMPSRKQPSWSMDADRPPANRDNNEGTMFKIGETWISRDLAFRVKVESATAEGFVVKVTSTRTRIKGGPGQSQQAVATSKPASAAVPASRPGVPRSSDRTGRRR